jgi:hypothetical protein
VKLVNKLDPALVYKMRRYALVCTLYTLMATHKGDFGLQVVCFPVHIVGSKSGKWVEASNKLMSNSRMTGAFLKSQNVSSHGITSYSAV